VTISDVDLLIFTDMRATQRQVTRRIIIAVRSTGLS